MTIEEGIFKRSKIDTSRLAAYGFHKEGDRFIYSKEIMEGHFVVTVAVSAGGSIEGKVYDTEFGGEYDNYRIEAGGSFAAQVRQEFEEILISIRENCAATYRFMSDQANRIADWVMETYGNAPEFLWEKFPEYGILRNPGSEKWYAAILNIPASKLFDKQANAENSELKDKPIDIINLKVDKNKVAELLPKNGYFQAYHMNKKYWVSVMLDETLQDEEIHQLISESYRLTTKGKR